MDVPFRVITVRNYEEIITVQYNRWKYVPLDGRVSKTMYTDSTDRNFKFLIFLPATVDIVTKALLTLYFSHISKPGLVSVRTSITCLSQRKFMTFKEIV